ncbi:MAG: hypothetical protein PHC51_04430 [bacterium]|nr:hypothetical protein [bacterium]
MPHNKLANSWALIVALFMKIVVLPIFAIFLMIILLVQRLLPAVSNTTQDFEQCE